MLVFVLLVVLLIVVLLVVLLVVHVVGCGSVDVCGGVVFDSGGVGFWWFYM